jgi:membrane dipeptidase
MKLYTIAIRSLILEDESLAGRVKEATPVYGATTFFFTLLFLACILACIPACIETDSAVDTIEKQHELSASGTFHDHLLTIDTHVDIPSNFASEEVDPGVWTVDPVSIPKMQAGGLDAAFFTVYVGQMPRTSANYAVAEATARSKFAAIHRMAEDLYPDKIEIAYSADDIGRINSAGRLVALIGIENGFAIGKDLSLLAAYYELGARYMTLAHSGHNDIADSTYPIADFGDGPVEHDGVSEFGGKVISEMNRLGMLVDVSHISKKATLDAARLSVAPIIASHSGARTVLDVPRNMDDEQLAAVAQTGGIISVVAYAPYVRMDPPAKRAAISQIETEMGFTSMEAIAKATGSELEDYRQRVIDLDDRWPRATVSDYVDHIDHVVEVVGIEHVAISSDFPAGGVTGWMDESESAAVTVELLRRGYGEHEIGKIWGSNLIRVLQAAERVAACFQSGRRPRDPASQPCQGGNSF